MGRAIRQKPKRLAEKLLQIRRALELSQNEMISRLGFSGEIIQDYISAHERAVREPPLPVLLEYARAANLYVDAFINDKVDLPESLPSDHKSEGIRRFSSSKRKY
jgi:transcriptional regulator with XRE-family HTH domain